MPAPALRPTAPLPQTARDSVREGLRVIHPDDHLVAEDSIGVDDHFIVPFPSVIDHARPAPDLTRPAPDLARPAVGLARPWFTWSTLTLSLVAGIIVATLAGCQWAAGSQNAQGAALYNQGQYTGAMEQFQKAIASNPTDPDGYYNLAATTHRLGNQRQDPNLIRQSEALYNQALDHDPNHVDGHRGLAVLLVDSGRPDRAFTLMKNWAAQNPNSSEPRIELARLYEEHGEPETALKYLEDAVQQDANNARAWLALARLRENGNDPVQALQNYQRALALSGGTMGANGPMAAERVAALSRQLNAANDARLNAGGTQIATPIPFGSTRY